jgi:hypothetical protein
MSRQAALEASEAGYQDNLCLTREADSAELRILCAEVAGELATVRGAEIAGINRGTTKLDVVRQKVILGNRGLVSPSIFRDQFFQAKVKKKVPSVKSGKTVKAVGVQEGEDSINYLLGLKLDPDSTKHIDKEHSGVWETVSEETQINLGAFTLPPTIRPTILLLRVPKQAIGEEKISEISQLMSSHIPLPVELEKVTFPEQGKRLPTDY